MTLPTAPRPAGTTLSLGDRLSRWEYLQQVELWLEPMPGRRRREVLRGLRSDIAESAAEVGMRAALADLGSPRRLARGFLDQEPATGPRWAAGVVAAGLVFGVWLYATVFYAFGMLDALGSVGSDQTGRGSFLGTSVQAVNDGASISASFSGIPWGPMVAMLVVFLLAARSWRLVRPAR